MTAKKISRKRSRRNSDRLKRWDTCRTACFRIKLLVSYVLHCKVIYITVCIIIEVETDWTKAKVKERVKIDLN